MNPLMKMFDRVASWWVTKRQLKPMSLVLTRSSIWDSPCKYGYGEVKGDQHRQVFIDIKPGESIDIGKISEHRGATRIVIGAFCFNAIIGPEVSFDQVELISQIERNQIASQGNKDDMTSEQRLEVFKAIQESPSYKTWAESTDNKPGE